MKKVLLITPLYKIIGRKDLINDSEAIHDLVKYWKDFNIDLHVIDIYINGLKKVFNLFNHDFIKYYNKGYNYLCDDIPVTLIERQNIYKGQIDGLKWDVKRYKKIIDKELNSFIPDKVIVHIPSTSKFIINKLDYDCDKVAVLHITDLKYYNKKGIEFIEYLNKNFKSVYCRSKSIYDQFKNTGINNLKEDIIYSGVNVKSLSINKNFNNKYQIIYVGKLIKRKNLDILLKALANINKDIWELTVIGEGPNMKKYKELTNKLGINNQVNYINNIPKEEVLKYMEASDIFCMPSINETFGLVYLEAMSKGCITIGTKNEGIDGIIIDKENGFLINPDVNELEKLLKDIIYLDLKEKQRLSNNAFKTALKYNELDMSINYLNKVMGDKNETKEDK